MTIDRKHVYIYTHSIFYNFNITAVEPLSKSTITGHYKFITRNQKHILYFVNQLF